MQNGLHAKSITIKFKLNNKYVTLDLSLNENLIPVGHFMRYQSTIGEEINIMEKTDIDLCQYKVLWSYFYWLISIKKNKKNYLFREK